MRQILGIGNALVDCLVRIDNNRIINDLHLHEGGMTLIDEKTYGELQVLLHRTFGASDAESAHILRSTGGSAGNALLALAQLGGVARFIGKTGHDAEAAFYLEAREEQGVHPIPLHHPHLPTGVATTFITPDGQRTFATHLGAAASMTAEDLREEWFVGCYAFFIEGYLVQNHQLIEAAVDMARRAGAKVCLDLASWNIVREDHDFFTHLLTKTDIVFANEEEAEAMTGLPADQALDALARQCPLAVVKLGARGACARSGDTYARVAACTVDRVVDTTGAGDFFAGGFLYAYALDRPLGQCLHLGACCAAEVIRVVGTRLPESVWDTLRAEAARL